MKTVPIKALPMTTTIPVSLATSCFEIPLIYEESNLKGIMTTLTLTLRS